MNTLKFVLIQGILSILLSVPAHTKLMPLSLNGIMRTLGSLYQDRLFNYGPGYSSYTDKFRGNDIAEGVPEVTEISVEKLCFKNYPICMVFEGTLTITENDVIPFVVRKPDDVKSCYSNFKFSDCKGDTLALPREKILDFSNVKVDDFCIPGTVKFDGSINVLKALRADEQVFLIFIKNGEASKEMEKYSLGPKCTPEWDYCNRFLLDDFLRKNPACHLWAEFPTLPCKSPVGENIYSLNSFRMNVFEDILEGTNINSGFISSRILLFGKEGTESCVEMTFNRTVF